MQFQRLNEAIKNQIENSHTWLQPSMLVYLIFALFSSLGRADINVGVAMLGFFFVNGFDKEQRVWYCLLLFVTFALDIVWLVINSNISEHFDNEGVDFRKGVTSFAFVMSIINMFVKLALTIALLRIHSMSESRSTVLPVLSLLL